MKCELLNLSPQILFSLIFYYISYTWAILDYSLSPDYVLSFFFFYSFACLFIFFFSNIINICLKL